MGIDLGIATYATLSDGSTYPGLSSVKAKQESIIKAQRAMAREVKFGCNWRKAKKRVARINTQIAHCRRDYVHKRAALADSWKLAQARGSLNQTDAEALSFASIEADIRALEMSELRIMSSLTVGQNPGSVSSMLKLRWSEIHQDITRLNLRLLGPDALIWEGARPLHVHQEDALLEDCARPMTAGYLNARAFTIFGGTSEIQREIIARELLG